MALGKIDRRQRTLKDIFLRENQYGFPAT